jgi:hypothetical protein
MLAGCSRTGSRTTRLIELARRFGVPRAALTSINRRSDMFWLCVANGEADGFLGSAGVRRTQPGGPF